MEIEIGEFIAHLTFDRDRAPNTTKRYRDILDRFASFARRELDRASIRPADIDRRLVELFVRHGGHEDSALAQAGAAASTRNVRLAAVRGFFAYLAAQDRLSRDPTNGLRSARSSPTPRDTSRRRNSDAS